jgi:hypothetical protein
MNVAKVALIIILLLLMIVIFFALTGLDVRNPMPAVERIIAWLGRFNRTVNVRIRAFFYRIRIRLIGGGSAPSIPAPGPGIDRAGRPLERLGEALGNLFQGFFGGMRDNSQEELVEPINP